MCQLNLALICQAVSEKKIFENGDFSRHSRAAYSAVRDRIWLKSSHCKNAQVLREAITSDDDDDEIRTHLKTNDCPCYLQD